MAPPEPLYKRATTAETAPKISDTMMPPRTTAFSRFICTLPAERRITTTLGHEGGHCLLHAHLFAVSSSARSLFGDPEAPMARSSSVVTRCRFGRSAGERRRYDVRWWEY